MEEKIEIAFNNFFKKIALFVLTFTLILLIMLHCSSIFLTEYSEQYNVDKKNLIIGDSHMVTSVIDSLLPNYCSYATYSESYYSSYFKIKFFSSKTPINNIILGYSYSNIPSYYDECINGKLSIFYNNKHFFLLPFIRQIEILFWNLKELRPFIARLIKTFYHHFYNFNDVEDTSLSLGFNMLKNPNVNLSSSNIISERIQEHYYIGDTKELQAISKLNLYYFDKIIKYCKENRINLILLTTPLSKEYKNKIPKKFKSAFTNFLIDDIEHINLENLNIPKEYYTPDGDHTYFEGALLTTLELRNCLNSLL